jgi:hypothetical protein
MEDDKIIMGRKEGGYRFLVANTKTGNLIAKIGLNRYRKEKLDKLNNVL